MYRAKLGTAGTLGFALRRLFKPKGSLIRLRVKNGGRLYLRNGFSDTVIFSQIFIYEELDFDLPFSPKIIIDCGANIGLSTLYFKFKYPDVKIVSVEPEASNFELLKKNTAAYTDIHLLKNGIWNKTCDLYLVDTGEGHDSFQVSETPTDKNLAARIEAVSIADVLERFGLAKVDLVKMDIEGSEYACFKGNHSEWTEKTVCIAVEIHEHMHPGCFSLINHSLPNYRNQSKGEYEIYTNEYIA